MKLLQCIAALVAAFPLMAQAQAVAEARLDSITFTVIDLDENDGVTPTFTWAPDYLGYSHQLSNSWNGDFETAGNLDPYSGDLTGAKIDPSASFVQDTNISHAHAGSTANGQNDLLSTALGAMEPPVYGDSVTGQGGIGIWGTFTLTGKGAVLITMPYSMRIAADACNPGGCNQAFALVGFVSEYGGASYQTVQELYSDGNGDSKDLAGELSSVDISNVSGNDVLTGTFYYVALTNVAAYAAPAPEPGTWAMLLAGLGLVGAAARRRRG